MFQIGDIVEGTTYTNDGPVQVIGAFQFRTDDPEEYIQDIVIRTADGKTVYINEQEARLYRPR
jgi:hypothetical protein